MRAFLTIARRSPPGPSISMLSLTATCAPGSCTARCPCGVLEDQRLAHAQGLAVHLVRPLALGRSRSRSRRRSRPASGASGRRPRRRPVPNVSRSSRRCSRRPRNIVSPLAGRTPQRGRARGRRQGGAHAGDRRARPLVRAVEHSSGRRRIERDRDDDARALARARHRRELRRDGGEPVAHVHEPRALRTVGRRSPRRRRAPRSAACRCRRGRSPPRSRPSRAWPRSAAPRGSRSRPPSRSRASSGRPRRRAAWSAAATRSAADAQRLDEPAVGERRRIDAARERADLVDRLLDLGAEPAQRGGALPVLAVGSSAASSSLMRSATSRCWAPSWRSRSIRRRSSSAVAWIRARDSLHLAQERARLRREPLVVERHQRVRRRRRR